MEVDFYQILSDSPLILIFTVLGLGLLVGRIRIAGMELGSTIGVLFEGAGKLFNLPENEILSVGLALTTTTYPRVENENIYANWKMEAF